MKKTASFYSELKHIMEKPEPFSMYTADILWTDPHISKMMLAFHLDPDKDISSRAIAFIDESVDWMVEHFSISDKSHIIDFGCGPGLYTSRLASCGAQVSGIDFSPTSIAYAREQAKKTGQNIIYHQANYLELEPEGTFDLITMVMCDYCALSPKQRSMMLKKFASLLSDKGRLVFDVYSLRSYDLKQEIVSFEKNLLDGFWSASPYYGFLTTFKYDKEQAGLDKYTIFEEKRKREVYNWFQYFSPESLKHELMKDGLEIELFLGNVAGHPFDSQGTEFAVVAKKP